jgi:hypothetical protein
MPDETKQYLIQLIGPLGVVRVNGKAQRFVEEASSHLELEQRLADRKMDIDPIKGSSRYEGRFIGCWVDVRELPDPQVSLRLDVET